jgi:hypothetical protein
VYRLYNKGIVFQILAGKINLFRVLRPVLGPTQSPIPLVPTALSLKEK